MRIAGWVRTAAIDAAPVLGGELGAIAPTVRQGMHPVELFELIVGMFLAVLALQYAALRLRLPPAAALLAGGGALAFVPGLPAVELDPELVLVVFLPPLLMDGAWFTALAPFRRHLAGIVSLAVGAVLFTAAVVAIVAKSILPDLPWAACVALGAIVSPPDAVSARAVLQRVKLPRRLATLLEGESLLNDATGLVLFRFAVAAVATGTFSVGEAIGSFAVLVGGGIAVGGAIGAAWVLLLRRLGDDHLMIAASVLVCWASYLAGETLLLPEAPESGCAYRGQFERHLGADGVVVSEKMEFQSIEAVKRCVAAGMGVSVLPDVAVEGELRPGGLSALAWDGAFDVRTRIAWHKERWQSPALGAFLEAAREVFGTAAAPIAPAATGRA